MVTGDDLDFGIGEEFGTSKTIDNDRIIDFGFGCEWSLDSDDGSAGRNGVQIAGLNVFGDEGDLRDLVGRDLAGAVPDADISTISDVPVRDSVQEAGKDCLYGLDRSFGHIIDKFLGHPNAVGGSVQGEHGDCFAGQSAVVDG